jgi:beta-N-acetylhexosaminidase
VSAKKDYSKLAGRLILGRTAGTELDAVTKQCLADGTIGGIVLFKENARTLEQLGELCKQIIETSYHPPVIAVDQEGGAVQRFEHLLTPLPSQMALAASQKEEFIEQCARINARQCRELGINCLLTPVMDVLTNTLNPVIATRSFGSNGMQVSQYSKIVLKAITEEGVTPVGKHFPGHGATLEDSHLSLAVNPNEETAIWKTDLLPFRECLSDLPALLVAHVWLKSIEEEPIPASLSHRIVSGVLRRYFEYDGIVMTDDMMMKAITDRWGLKEASLMALQASCDLLLICAEPSQTLAVTHHIAEAIKSGKLTNNSVEQATRRLNKRFGNRLKPITKQGLKALKLDVATQTEVTLTAAAASIALLTRSVAPVELGDAIVEPARGTWRNPIGAQEWVVVAPKHPGYPLGLVKFLEELSEGSELEQGKTPPTLSELRYALDPGEKECSDVAAKCKGKNCIYLTFRSVSNSGQIILANLLKEKAQQVVTVACETPFDITVISGFKHALATFDPSELGMRGLACVLLGIIEPLGSCPVDLHFATIEQK